MDMPTFLRTLEVILEIDSGKLQNDTKLKDIAEWDSLAILGFIAWVDNLNSRQLKTEDIIKAQCVSDLYKLGIE